MAIKHTCKIKFCAPIKIAAATFLILFLHCLCIKAADSLHFRPLTIAFTNNATALPGSGKLGILDLPIHAGITVGTYFNLKEKTKSKLIQDLKFGYFNHRFGQQALQLYTETRYEHSILKKMSANISYGIGYLHSIAGREIFVLNNQGVYERKKDFGRAQLMTGLSLGLKYTTHRTNKPPIRYFINYQFWLQLPFIKDYVPILPCTSLHAGIEIPLKMK